MSAAPPIPSSARPRRLLAAFGIWTLVGLYFTTQHYVHIARVFDGQASWRRSLLSTLPDWYLWGALAPLVFWIARRWPIGQGRGALSLAVHAAAAPLVAAAHLVAAVAVFMLLSPIPGATLRWGQQLEVNFVLSFHWNVLTYLALVAWSHAGEERRRSAERERDAMALQARLAAARLESLRARLEPHFLFNALNAVAELVHTSPARAEEMLLLLGDLLRAALREAPPQEAPLAEELQLVEKYLEIECVRFGARLRVEVSAAPETLGALVPSFVLQPLAENAVRHGIARRAAAGKVALGARRRGEVLELEVEDDGPGPALDEAMAARGIGLSHTRERLRGLYGDRQELRIEPRVGGGTRVVLRLPFRAGLCAVGAAAP